MKAGPFASRRSAVLARHGMVATSQPLAAQAGLRVLMDGGNAADAAVTTAAMLNVVQPMSTGIGGDCFALIFESATGQVSALNGSGRAPQEFTLGEAQRLGISEIPLTGPLPVTVPGTVAGWAALLERFGTLSLGDCLAPAIATAETGFPVSERISASWHRLAEKVARDPEASRIYLPAPKPGHFHQQPDLARTFRSVAEGGVDAFYRGPAAELISDCVQSQGGYMTADDLAAHASTWEIPIRTTYRDAEILEHPPNGQGLAALIALNIVEGWALDETSFYDAQRWHRMIEAMRIGMVDAGQYVADPALANIPVEHLLSSEYAGARRASIQAADVLDLTGPRQPEHRDTVYLTAVDGAGNAISFINSLYYAFGSGLVVPGTGICLQNRGACFTLEPEHPNVLAGGKRPYHTIIPAMALRDGSLWLTFGVMGGFMQPQGHLQVAINMIDYTLDPQQALDAPRFRVDERGGLEVFVEDSVPEDTRTKLSAMGHKVRPEPTFAPGFGGGQVIAVDPESGALWGGSDPRYDGCAVGY
ncbi:gamma-glutamyltransferase [Chloroflexota bacterium]